MLTTLWQVVLPYTNCQRVFRLRSNVLLWLKAMRNGKWDIHRTPRTARWRCLICRFIIKIMTLWIYHEFSLHIHPPSILPFPQLKSSHHHLISSKSEVRCQSDEASSHHMWCQPRKRFWSDMKISRRWPLIVQASQDPELNSKTIAPMLIGAARKLDIYLTFWTWRENSKVWTWSIWSHDIILIQGAANEINSIPIPAWFSNEASYIADVTWVERSIDVKSWCSN